MGTAALYRGPSRTIALLYTIDKVSRVNSFTAARAFNKAFMLSAVVNISLYFRVLVPEEYLKSIADEINTSRGLDREFLARRFYTSLPLSLPIAFSRFV